MGYFKNQIIANQVELGDRIPAPKPATDHVAYSHGILSRRWIRHIEREHNREHTARLIVAGSIALAVGIVAGFAVGVFA